MIRNKPFLIVGIFLIFMIIQFVMYEIFNKESINKIMTFENTQNISFYKNLCINHYKKLRYPNKSLYFNPPIKIPPYDMYDEFTQYGKMPIKKWYYINEIYSDSNGNNKKEANRVINDTEINYFRKRVKNNKPLGYGDHVLNELMHLFEPKFKYKYLGVIGTQSPWIESIGLEVGFSKVTTLDYTRAEYEYPNMKWFHVNDYLDKAILNSNIEEFDVIASFSSLEHSGLGRYGDPINPKGDIEAVRQIHCMLKQGGLFFLGLPTNDDGSSHIEFNAHRIYGTERLKLLFKGWNVLLKKKDSLGSHTIFVLQKKPLVDYSNNLYNA